MGTERDKGRPVVDNYSRPVFFFAMFGLRFFGLGVGMKLALYSMTPQDGRPTTDIFIG